MQRTILINGQGTNTVWAGAASNTSFYGVVQGPFFQDAGFTNATGNANGGYAECAFAGVLSRMFHCVGTVAPTHPTLSSSVNVMGQVPASSAFETGAGNQASVTASGQNITFPSYWYDATDIDAITAGQQIGLMQSITAPNAGPINPSLGVICDSVDAGFCSPFLFPMSGAANGSVYLTGPYYSHLGGNSGNTEGAGFTSNVALAQDYSAGAFVASWLQWQPGVNTDTKGQMTAAFAFGATVGAVTATSLTAAIAHAGALGIQHDATDIAAVPAGSYSCLKWTGQADSSTIKLGNAGVHIRPSSNNATLLVTGTRDANGMTWAGAASTNSSQVLNTTFTTFGAPRDDKLYTENMVSIPTAGVFANLALHTGSQVYGGTPATFTLLNGPNSGETVSGSQGRGTISTNGVASFAATTLLLGDMNAASTWFFDTTDIAAFTPFNGLLLALYSAAGGSGNATTPLSVTVQGYSVNFTAPAHLGLTTMGAG